MINKNLKLILIINPENPRKSPAIASSLGLSIIMPVITKRQKH